MDAVSHNVHAWVWGVLHVSGICLPLCWLMGLPSWPACLGSAKDEQEENQPLETDMHKMLVCWQVRAEPLLVKWWHVECLWLPLACLFLWAFTGTTCLCCQWRVGSVWPLLLRIRTADCLLHPSLCHAGLCGVCWCSADSWKDQAGFSAVLTSVLSFFPDWSILTARFS